MTALLTPEQVAELWAPAALSLNDGQIECLSRLIGWMDARQDCLYACALRGREPKKPIAASSVEAVTAQELARRFRMALLSDANLEGRSKDMLNIVAKIADRANALGWLEICPPPIAVSIPLEPSPYAPENWPRVGMAHCVRNALAIGVTQRSNDRSPAATLGRCVISAVVHGGLLCVEALDALALRLAEPVCPLETFGPRLSIDLELGYQGQPAAELRRWFPDALSALLIMRLPSETVVSILGLTGAERPTGAPPRQKLWRVIQAGLASLDPPPDVQPRSLSAFLEDVQLDMLLRLPPILVHYASRRIISHSLKRHVWGRLHGVRLASAEVPQEEVDDPKAGPDDEAVPSGELEPRWMAALREALKPNDLKRMEGLLHAQIEAALSPASGEDNGAFFAQFALYLVRYRLSSGRPLKPRTIRAYALSIARRIGGKLGQEPARLQDPILWVRLYEQALEETDTPAARYKLARQLRSFHRYLAEILGLDPQVGRPVLGAAGGLMPVEANLISPEEFRASLAQVEEAVRLLDRPDEGLERIARLVLILGYRCGLRPGEARLIELVDVYLEPPAELLIRESALKTLKTPNATRKIPLSAVLEPAELAELVRWTLRRRQAEAAVPYSPYLFGLPERDFQVVPERTLLPIVHRAMREATGDPTAHYYNLRHSFGTWTFLKLVIAGLRTYAKPPDLAPLRPYERKFNVDDPLVEVLNEGTDFHRRLYGHCSTSRKHAYAVASLLGHSEPSMSCEHYIHCMDLLWAEALAQDDSAPLRKTIVALSEHSSTKAYRLTTGPEPMQIALLEAQATLAVKTELAAHLVSPRYEVEDRAASARLVSLWRILLLYSTRRTSLTSLATRCRQSVPTLLRWVRRANILQQMRSGRRTKGFRHRFMEWQADRRVAETVRTLCPIKPREARDVAILNELTPRFRQAFMRDPLLCRKALGYFVRNMWQTGTTLVFRDPADPVAAQAHLAFLRLVGFQREEIRFIAFDTNIRSRAVAQWKRALSLTWREQFVRQAPTNRAHGKGCLWLGIRPVFGVGVREPEKENQKDAGETDDKGDETPAGAGAFRYLMLMAAILMGWEGEDADLGRVE